MGRMMKADSREAAIILSNMGRNLMRTRRELAERTGIKDQTLGLRFRQPDGLRLFELRNIWKETGMSYSDLLRVTLGDLFNENGYREEAVKEFSADFMNRIYQGGEA